MCLQRVNCSAGSKSPDDVVVVASVRTPITKAKKGGLKDTLPDDLMAIVMKDVLQKTGVDPKDIGDVVFGSVLGPNSQRANEVRIAMFLGGMPVSVPCRIVNRQCSSGLQAIADVASAIKAGYYTIGLAGGVETMTLNPMKWEGGINPATKTNSLVRAAAGPKQQQQNPNLPPKHFVCPCPGAPFWSCREGCLPKMCCCLR
mmetsp:Transcript_39080/g.110697  ORF Transcript_39080/g.110697 Transcript_39080/m.110697 type:complete len:201 (-) Transcript_39080:168-770(-)